MDIDREKSVAFTGYRPAKMRVSSGNPDIEKEVRTALGASIRQLYEQGFRYFLTGMAEGFDLWAADEVLNLAAAGECPDARIVAVVPFRGQPARFADEYRVIYDRIIKAAYKTFYLSGDYFPECYYRRNDFLVNNSAAVLCYFDGLPGGTKYTFNKARKAGLPVYNICSPTLF